MDSKTHQHLGVVVLGLVMPVFYGCAPDTATGRSGIDSNETTIDESIEIVDLDFAPPEIEGHTHDHEIGPHGGHVVRLQPGDQKAEWLQIKEEDTVQIYLPETKDIQLVSMKIALGDGPKQEFDLPRQESLGDGAYQIISPELMTAIGMKDAVTVSLRVKSADDELTAPIEHVGCSCGQH